MPKSTRHMQHAAVWTFDFPNGQTASLIPDLHIPARFELHSTALNVGGDTIRGLTSAEVDAHLAAIAGQEH